ncbi:hypothetical protein [Salmonirosea aquatica]|uniref:Uncharacterized protein n=1 Tax=Salmonirosea aquatica TaxID=2654236 RepID=A0A7C9BE72_9BACT|nr:hypothetical protein [Cytophagaceae bacterium SJW1-29]
MATMVQLEGTNVIFNLDHVLTIQKGTVNATQKEGIVFNLLEKNEVIWEFVSGEARDEAFEALLTTTESRMF